MEGINRSKHQNLTSSIANSIQFLSGQYSVEASAWLRALCDKKNRLEELHQEYQMLLNRLEKVTVSYHQEANDPKIRLMFRRVKKMKTTIAVKRLGPKAFQLPDSLRYGA